MTCNDVVLCVFCISDDGKLSFEEFNTYFADGILTTEELQELFYSIDGRQNRCPCVLFDSLKKWIHYFLFYGAIIKESFIMKDYYELDYNGGLDCGFMLKRASHESCRQNYCEHDTWPLQ